MEFKISIISAISPINNKNKVKYVVVAECSKHQAGNLRVEDFKPSGSRQPLTPGCQKINKLFLAKVFL